MSSDNDTATAGLSEADKSTLKDFAEAASTQAKNANRIWLALLVASSLVAFPEVKDVTTKVDGKEVTTKRVKLPFNLASVPKEQFGTVGLGVVSALTLAFCSAHLHTVRTQNLGFAFLDELDDDVRLIGQRYFDAIRVAEFTRVAPFKDWLGDYLPASFSALRKFVFGVLKILVTAPYFGLPALAIYEAAQHLGGSWSLVEWIAVVVAAAAGLGLIQCVVADAVHTFVAAKNDRPAAGR